MVTDPGHFRPFETSLDAERSLRTVKAACAGGEDGELFLERHRAQTLVFDDGRLRDASYSASEGFGLRAVAGETAGYAHSSEISEAALQRAMETARFAVRNGGGIMAPPPHATNQKLYAETDPVSEMQFPARVELMKEIDAYARGLDHRVVQATAVLASSLQEIEILRPDGALMRDRRPMVRLNVSVIVEENGERHSGYAGEGGRYSLLSLTEPHLWQGLAKEALRIALLGLSAEPAPAGVFDVVLGPGWPGILLHEAVGHGLEGDFNRKQTSAFAGLMGQRIAAGGVTVVDDGTIADRRGSISVDDEGTPGQTTTLIEDGILVGYMQDRQNARLTGVQSTGNGRRQSYAHPPMPRMTNTFMLAGSGEPADIAAELRDGIHAVGFGGGQVDITSGKFVFSCTEAYRVRNGKIGTPVKNATLIGDGATALRNIRAIGNDLQLDPGIGNCGKNGQWVPVGVGLPTLLIGGLTVGGQVA
ncbi:MAG: metallopeptidase TldD-related protein [Rhodobacteraceae bacterium]|nr:metallopeptidase TldD-related protein [Paracoccaceae bacterium]